MKRQEGHLPERQGLVVGCRILGVLAVDVCKGFVVTTMCLSCEKDAGFQILQQQSRGQTRGWQSKVSKKYEKTKNIHKQKLF